MKKRQVDGSVLFELRTPLVPWGTALDKYILCIDGSITVRKDTRDQPAGRIRLAVVKMAEALYGEVELYDVLQSCGLQRLYTTIFNRDGQFARDVRIEAAYGDLLVVESLEPEPAFDTVALRNQIVETATATFASASIMLVKKGVLGLAPVERMEKGYVDLLHYHWVLLDNWRQNSFERL